MTVTQRDWHPATPEPHPDLTTRAGAELIAERLRAYWAERGYRVEPEIKPVSAWSGAFKVTLPPFSAKGWPVERLSAARAGAPERRAMEDARMLREVSR